MQAIRIGEAIEITGIITAGGGLVMEKAGEVVIIGARSHLVARGLPVLRKNVYINVARARHCAARRDIGGVGEPMYTGIIILCLLSVKLRGQRDTYHRFFDYPFQTVGPVLQ